MQTRERQPFFKPLSSTENQDLYVNEVSWADRAAWGRSINTLSLYSFYEHDEINIPHGNMRN